MSRSIQVFRDAPAPTAPLPKKLGGTTSMLGQSFITTNISTITLNDKENLDPVTGLPLSSFLNKLTDSAKSSSKPNTSSTARKYIATTITTTVFSPVPISKYSLNHPSTPSPAKSKLTLKTAMLQAGKKPRVALGAKSPSRTNASHRNTASPSTATPSKSKLGHSKLSSSSSPKTTLIGSTGSSSPSSAHTLSKKKSKSRTGVTAKAKRVKKLAIAKHAAAVAAAASDNNMPEQDPHEAMDTYRMSDDTSVMDVDYSNELDVTDRNDVGACMQRIVDQRCRELTVQPLANVSEAYGVSSDDGSFY